MIELRNESSHAPLSQLQVREIRTKLDGDFPDDYCTYLLKLNGGEPRWNTCFVPGLDVPHGLVDELLSIDGNGLRRDVGVSQSLKGTVAHCYAKHPNIPAEFIPIAIDEFGNIFALSILSPTGSVVLLVPDYHKQFLKHEVADTFSEFLSHFKRGYHIEETINEEGTRVYDLQAFDVPLSTLVEFLDSVLSISISHKIGADSEKNVPKIIVRSDDEKQLCKSVAKMCGIKVEICDDVVVFR